MILALALPFLAGGIAPLVGRRLGTYTGLLGAIAGLGSFLLLAGLAVQPASVVVRWDWIPSVGTAFEFRADGLGAFFGLLVTGIGAIVFVYSIGYMSHDRDHGRFFAYLAFFMGSMLGLVLAYDLIVLFVFWEATTVTSFLLTGFHRQDAKAAAGAFKAFALTGLGGIALLFAFLGLRSVTGSFSLAVVLASGDAIRASTAYPWIAGLLVVGAGTKAAQFPFHIWLPDAMVAPTPVSAYLHSAAMVKAGIFLLARILPAVASPAWTYVLVPLGVGTSILGGFLAIGAVDLKRILAYSTVGQLGLLTAAFGVGIAVGAEAGTVHVLSHSFFKAALFLVAGAVTLATGVSNIRQLGGLRRAMPVTFAACALAALASAGLPPTGGFLSKELLFEALGSQGTWVLPFVALSGALTTAYSLYFVGRVFLGPVRGDVKVGRVPRTVVGAALLLGALSLALGVAPSWFEPGVVGAASATVREPVAFTLSPLPAFSLELAVGFASILGGVALYARYERIADAVRGLTVRLAPVSVDRMYEGLAAHGRDRISKAFRALQNGSLTRYTSALLLFALIPLSATVVSARWSWPDVSDSQNIVILTVLVAVVGFASIASIARRTMLAVLALSGMGFMIALLFMLLNAPDLALTQLLVEIVFLAMFLVVLFRIPKEYEREPHRRGWRDIGIAAGVAIVIAAVLSMSLNTFAQDSIAQFYLDPGLIPRTGGDNVVNVIITDFRALDTLGETTVIALAALAAYTVLRRWKS